MKNNISYIGLGSNLGDKTEYCKKAIDLISQLEGTSFVKMSSLYRSEPLGPPDQDWYINAVIQIKTSLSPRELLAALHMIEFKLSRRREVHWGPRTIDLDILFYNGDIIKEDDLKIPHPEAHKRSFVLIPLSEIASEYIHPELKQTVSELLHSLEKKYVCSILRSESPPFIQAGDLS